LKLTALDDPDTTGSFADENSTVRREIDRPWAIETADDRLDGEFRCGGVCLTLKRAAEKDYAEERSAERFDDDSAHWRIP